MALMPWGASRWSPETWGAWMQVRLGLSDLVAAKMPIHLSDRVAITVETLVWPAQGSTSWMRRRLILDIRLESSDYGIPLLRLPGRVLAEIPTECPFDDWTSLAPIPVIEE